MSWLFGGGGGGDDDNDNDNNNNEKNQNYDNDYDDDDDDDITDKRKAKVIADFDSTSLVEGADALKQIDASPNSKEVLRLQVEAQKTKQIELRNRGRQMERANMEYREALMKREAESQKERDDFQHQRWKEKMEEEQRRKEQSEQRILQQKQKAQQEWIEKQRQLNEENLQKQRQVLCLCILYFAFCVCVSQKHFWFFFLRKIAIFFCIFYNKAQTGIFMGIRNVKIKIKIKINCICVYRFSKKSKKIERKHYSIRLSWTERQQE